MAILAGSGYVCGTQIEAVMQLNNADYVPQRWHGTLLFWATVLVAVFINTILGRLLPAIEIVMLIVHVLGFFAILIPLVVVRHPLPMFYEPLSVCIGLFENKWQHTMG